MPLHTKDGDDAITRRELLKVSGLGAGAILLSDAGSAADSTSRTPVEAAPLPAGVRAVWDLKHAYREKSPTRERVCLNGLWRWQPSHTTAPQKEPPLAGWGWLKAPGCWPGITDYLQKDCQVVIPHANWKNENMAGVSVAWYQREFIVPADWKGRRVLLSLEYLNTFATIYVGSRLAGEIRFPAGQLDVSAYCRPGETQVLTILVQASPLRAVMLSYTDTNAAREVKGSVERRGLCGDVWLIGETRAARISDVKIDTSVTRGEIAFDAALEGLVAGATYSLQAHITDKDQSVHESPIVRFTSSDLKRGRIRLREKWIPRKLWDLNTPLNQFSAALTLSREGALQDRSLPVRFGFREFLIKGKDFYLNGSRIYLASVPVDNAQVGAAWASYEGAKETLSRFKNLGMNFVYTHNYSCEPGAHLSFSEILRAADDVGILVAFAQPHFSNYEWAAPDADQNNGYAKHAEFYVRAAQNHPSVVAYAMSHNATGYVEEANPDMIDGLQDPREEWGRRNSVLALRAEAIVKQFDASRIVYHHSSGNLGSMHTCNFYVNFVPAQELCDWFEHWEEKGVKPLFLCEYGVPCTWDWTMYRGWYQGKREWGSANVPWEFCIAEWNAQFVGDSAYNIGEREKKNLRWEAERFKTGQGWHRWDYPTQVGTADFPDTNAVFHDYVTDCWRAYRSRGVSAFGPWEYEMYWSLKGDADRSRKQLAVDWDRLQRPGFSADYIDDRPANIALAYERSDWLPTPAGAALLRNNEPVLAYIAGKASALTSKEHNYLPGESLEKQIIIINNSRAAVTCEYSWSLDLSPAVTGSGRAAVQTGNQARIPIKVILPALMDSGKHKLNASVRFSTGEVQTDSFDLHVNAPPIVPRAIFTPNMRIAVFDPLGETSKMLNGVAFKAVSHSDDLANYDILIIGKAALTKDSAGPDLNRVRDGLRVIVMEQTAEALEQRLGFRVAEYGIRQMFHLMRNSLLLAGLPDDRLRDWRGEATLLSPRLKYTIGDRYSPQVKWCGLDVTRVWRCGCRGSVASVLIEKPACGDFTPIVHGGYGMQYAGLMEYREGKGMILFCQMDVTGRTEREPAAAQLFSNVLRHAADWTPASLSNSAAYYIGEQAGKVHFSSAGIVTDNLPDGKLLRDAVLIVGPEFGAQIRGREAEVKQWVSEGGRMLAIGLDEAEANVLSPVRMERGEHISTHFDPPRPGSWLSGVSPADVHNRDPRTIFLVSKGAEVVGNGVVGNGVLARYRPNTVYSQLAPWRFSSKAPMNQKRTFRHLAFLTTRLAANMLVECRTPLLSRFAAPAAPGDNRYLKGLYMDIPEEWDDPYRFFGW